MRAWAMDTGMSIQSNNRVIYKNQFTTAFIKLNQIESKHNF